MSDSVKPEVTHYREFIRRAGTTRAICHQCRVAWPCLVASGKLGAASWWYVNPQQPKAKRDQEA